MAALLPALLNLLLPDPKIRLNLPLPRPQNQNLKSALALRHNLAEPRQEHLLVALDARVGDKRGPDPADPGRLPADPAGAEHLRPALSRPGQHRSRLHLQPKHLEHPAPRDRPRTKQDQDPGHHLGHG